MTRPCTCHPNDRLPTPCPGMHAFRDCVISAWFRKGGRWVWVPDTKRITLRDKAKAQAYDRRWQKDNRKVKPNSV